MKRPAFGAGLCLFLPLFVPMALMLPCQIAQQPRYSGRRYLIGVVVQISQVFNTTTKKCVSTVSACRRTLFCGVDKRAIVNPFIQLASHPLESDKSTTLAEFFQCFDNPLFRSSKDKPVNLFFPLALRGVLGHSGRGALRTCLDVEDIGHLVSLLSFYTMRALACFVKSCGCAK